MWNDIRNLRDVYDNPQGQAVQRILADQNARVLPRSRSPIAVGAEIYFAPTNLLER